MFEMINNSWSRLHGRMKKRNMKYWNRIIITWSMHISYTHIKKAYGTIKIDLFYGSMEQKREKSHKNNIRISNFLTFICAFYGRRFQFWICNILMLLKKFFALLRKKSFYENFVSHREGFEVESNQGQDTSTFYSGRQSRLGNLGHLGEPKDTLGHLRPQVS